MFQGRCGGSTCGSRAYSRYLFLGMTFHMNNSGANSCVGQSLIYGGQGCKCMHTVLCVTALMYSVCAHVLGEVGRRHWGKEPSKWGACLTGAVQCEEHRKH